MATKAWQSYEKVAQHLLDQFAEHFELGHVEGKQLVAGNSGTEWEIDAKGVSEGAEAFLIIECRRYTKSRLNQESMAALAFRIQDTGAKGGIVVSPMELQRGAKKVAASANIQHVTLDPQSTTSDYMLRFLNQVFVGVSDSVTVTDSVHIQVIRDGKVIDERKA
ncbi:restriction endonuclease [Nitrococcus mobilis]|uniref:Restriction endonuclease type IV Mrr domain-containing protein n=1 Tax=Nitrococcus mobilis Nb-231 TaxID=314278 RepID=A4BVQ9_9GAMM|nr:restriction endonuclease [Nitrococcus mobilis]EAR20181.1 hypothetical protein NB231_13751 [Nitrococcus mobilis Nb-231]